VGIGEGGRRVGVAVGVGVGVGVDVGKGVLVGFGVGVTVGVRVGVDVSVGTSVEVGMTVGAVVGDGVGVDVGLPMILVAPAANPVTNIRAPRPPKAQAHTGTRLRDWRFGAEAGALLPSAAAISAALWKRAAGCRSIAFDTAASAWALTRGFNFRIGANTAGFTTRCGAVGGACPVSAWCRVAPRL